MKILFILFAVVLMASCTTQRKAEKWMDKNQKEAAEYCAFRFPAQESIVEKDSIVIDTQYLDNGWVVDDTQSTNEYWRKLSSGQYLKGITWPLPDNRSEIRDPDSGGGLSFKYMYNGPGQPAERLVIFPEGKVGYKCPPTPVITKTHYKDRIITKADGALVASLRFQVGEQGKRADNLQHELQQAKTDGEKWKEQRNKLRWILFVLAGGAAVWLFIKLKTRIPIVGRSVK